MVDIDKVQTAGALAEMLRRAVREKRVELLRDEETDARAALVPWELLLELAEAGGPPMEELRGRLRELTSLERGVRQETQQSAQDPPPPRPGQREVDPENAASVALLQSWLEEDATDNPEEVRGAQEELEEFKRGINVERERAGARRIYP